ncbi:MAG: UDP:flavonoid glycosyltransferase YjiC (YdhE family) [Planctomycetota bacterium]|jgi:UDP:flavonoid glycosyltransferase YjiC (YdhE family)
MELVGPAIGSPIQSPPAPPILDRTPHLPVTIGTHLLWAKERAARIALEFSPHLPGWTVHFSRGDVEAARSREPVRQIGPSGFEFPYIPYGKNLGNYAAIVHHGGSGISYAALSEGVPAAVWPHDYDQFDHAAQIEYHGFGLRSDGDPGRDPNGYSLALAHAVQRLVREPRFRERARWMAERIARTAPAEAAANAFYGL